MVSFSQAASKNQGKFTTSKIQWLFVGALLIVIVFFDLMVQAPLAGLIFSFLALLWLVAMLMAALIMRKKILTILLKNKGIIILLMSYFLSVACGLLISHLVMHQAQALRSKIHAADSYAGLKSTAIQQGIYYNFCASRMTGQCGFGGYRINLIALEKNNGNDNAVLVVDQFFTERVSISISTGEVLQKRSFD